MALFKTLKQVKQAMSPEAIKQGLEASRAEMSGAGTSLSDEQLAAMAPEQRAAYDAATAQAARGQAEAAAAHAYVESRQAFGRVVLIP